MNTTITITRKGQTTLPVEIRRKLGLDNSGGSLQIRFDEKTKELTISKALTAADLSAQISQYIKPGTKPLTNVDEYYQKNRPLKKSGE